MADRSFVYGLRSNARVVCPLLANTQHKRFVVGTCDLRVAENEIHIIDFDDVELEASALIYTHKHEIRYLAPHPSKEDFILSAYQICDKNDRGFNLAESVSLWRLKDMKFDSDRKGALVNRKTNLSMDKLCTANEFRGFIHSIFWESMVDNAQRFCTVDDRQLKIWSIAGGSTEAQLATSIDCEQGEDNLKFGKGQWNPNNANLISIGSGPELLTFDLKSNKVSNKIENANNVRVRSLDHNPNRQNYIAVGGDDCCIRIFDFRNPKKALIKFHEHNHWIWSVAFNPFHDQLLLSGGSDDQVILYNSLSIYGARDEVSSKTRNENTKPVQNISVPLPPRKKSRAALGDGMLEIFEQHEESVYGVCWSSADPWVFASISYDGRLVLNTVSDEIKFNVIL